jgi:hypothetical protein
LLKEPAEAGAELVAPEEVQRDRQAEVLRAAAVEAWEPGVLEAQAP